MRQKLKKLSLLLTLKRILRSFDVRSNNENRISLSKKPSYDDKADVALEVHARFYILLCRNIFLKAGPMFTY